jgi:tRNA A37 threonylcarbamoyladenosine biosynthesis protein TsaE
VDGGDPWMAMEVEEAMDGRNIVLIEWPGPVAETLSPERLDIEIHTGSDEESREFLLSGDDRIWKERLEGLLS